jgi:LemA protein
MKTGSLVIGGLLLVVFALLAGGCSGYNKLNVGKQQVDKAWADVQNVYERRADLIPNLVKTVEGSAAFEQQTLSEVVEARKQVTNVQLDPNAAPTDAASLERFQASQIQLSSALSRLLAVVEAYPEVKSTAAFRDLQTQLEGTENRIAVERRKFNKAVQDYNILVNSLPTRLYAGMFGFHPRPYFTARDGSDVAPSVNFEFNKPAR